MPARPHAVQFRASAWLLLVFQLPARPSNARVKTWRRLQKLGAQPVRNSAYVLPESPQAREDFEWIKAEIVAMKGQADLFVAENLDPAASAELVAAFRRASAAEYQAMRRAAAALGRGGRALAGGTRLRLARTIRKLRERWSEAAATDFFNAPGREEAAAALDEWDRRLAGPAPRADARAVSGGTLMPEKFRERVWVTRPRPGIDRMSSAWLIRSFIDPRARFRFAEKPQKAGSAVPFDMFGVEFSHQGGRCTFEHLAHHFRISSPAITRLGQIVHDLDLKDARYGVEEAPAIGRLVEGLRQVHADDHELLEQGMAMFEALYRSLEAQPKGAVLPARTKKRAERRKSA